MPRLLLCILLVSSSALGFGQTLNVFAASSLTEAFRQVATAFERRHPEVNVALNLAGSSTLSFQITQGAPADVFASADQAQMQVVAEADLVLGEPAVFAHNRLVVVTPADSTVRDLGDLARPGTLIVLAGPEVPVGRYAREVIGNLSAVYGDGYAGRVLDNVVSLEPNVRQAAAKVELGEADAAFVYATDAAVLSGVRTLEIPEAHNIRASYPIAVVKGSGHPESARAFVEFVLSAEGQRLLLSYGFQGAD